MIIVSSLAYTYGNSRRLSFPDFSVASGKSCLLLGNSGSGKTTLLHLMGGLLKIQEGTVEINGVDLSSLSEGQADTFRAKHIGFIFQKNHLLSSLSVKQNLMMAPFLANLNHDDNRMDEVLAQLGLWEKKNAKVTTLSQGQAQRVAIARALLNRPSVIIADEPTSALDDENCDRVISLLLNVAKQNQSTLLVATHDQRLKRIIPRQVILTNP
jgi:putative ABC transport system ATP-binding protein